MERRIKKGVDTRHELRGATNAGYIATNAPRYAKTINIDANKVLIRTMIQNGKLDKATADWIISDCLDKARYSRGYNDSIRGALNGGIVAIHYDFPLDNIAVKTLITAADAVAGMCVAGLGGNGNVKTPPTKYTIAGVSHDFPLDVQFRVNATMNDPQKAATELSHASREAASMATRGWINNVSRVGENQLEEVVDRDIWS